jgi:hypothetical protein
VLNLVLLQISMVFKQVILKLNVAFNFTYVPFRVTLCFLLIFVYLPFKLIIDAFLQRLNVLFSFFLHPFALSLEIVVSLSFNLKDIFILLVCVFEMAELRDVVCQVVHLVLSSSDLIILSFTNLIHLILVTVLQLALNNRRVGF